MLAHEFENMPVRVTDPRAESLTMLRCKWCMKTPTKAREDGCAIRELEEKGSILLSDYNPDGVAYFAGRKCITCDTPIMNHTLRRGNKEYWCFPNQNMFSYGVEKCVVELNGVEPQKEATEPKHHNLDVKYT